MRVIYMSLDPYMRGRMRDAASYAAPVGIGEVMTGGTVGEVVKSNHPGFKVGDIVEDRLGWQEYAIGPGPAMRKVDPSLAPISTANGVLGMPGMTAYFGLYEVGQPKAGETVVVSAASGAVGQLVGQLAKIAGCRAVGIAGGAKKCAFVKDTLGFDACIDYKAEKDLAAAVKAACPNGVDVYFDNVGGVVSDAVLVNLNFWARVALCGSISQYNTTEPGPRLLGTFVGKRVTMRGFIVWDFNGKYGPAMRQMGEWVRSGRIKYKEDIVEGIENAPRAFIGLLRGDNFGKMQVKLGPDPGGAVNGGLQERIAGAAWHATSSRPVPSTIPTAAASIPTSTALLVIDLQNDFLSPDGYLANKGYDLSPLRAILPAVNRVIDAARAAGCLIVFTRQGHRADMADMARLRPPRAASGRPRRMPASFCAARRASRSCRKSRCAPATSSSTRRRTGPSPTPSWSRCCAPRASRISCSPAARRTCACTPRCARRTTAISSAS